MFLFTACNEAAIFLFSESNSTTFSFCLFVFNGIFQSYCLESYSERMRGLIPGKASKV